MSKTTINSPHAPAAIGPYSHAVAAQGFLFVSGQLPIHPITGEMPVGMAAQTRQVMDNLLAIIKEAGAGVEDIVRMTIFLTDMNDFAEVNDIYASYFSKDYPARAAIGVTALPKGARLEIDAIATLATK